MGVSERIFCICECHSLEHQYVFWYDEEDDVLYCEPHLTTHKNFFKRLWIGIKYAFGHKAQYGDWDEFSFKKEDLEKLNDFLNKKRK